MINNNALSNRLNAVKKGKPLPAPPPLQQPLNNMKQQLSPKDILIQKAFMVSDVLLASFIYGFALKTIFVTDWSLFGAFSVGLLLNHAIGVFPKMLFPKKYKG